MGATPLGLALALVFIHGGAGKVVAALIYPVGYVAVILGRGQLFTENTLYPIVPSLENPRLILDTVRLTIIVLAANLVGVLAFGALAALSPALPTKVVGEIVHLGAHATHETFAKAFWSATVAGWVLALVAWVIEASNDAIGKFSVIFLLTLVVGLGSFDHSVATAIEVATATIHGDAGVGSAFAWQAAATLGNLVGGIVIVALLNYGQVRQRRS